MKKLLVGAVLLGSTSLAMAEAPGGPDCGWGNMLFEGQSGLGPHFLASWTNGTSGNATFGMTSGTNGCSPNGTLTYGGDSLISLTNMMDEFVADAAKGEGEAMNAVAVSMGIAPEDRAHFAATIHSQFSSIFTSADVTAQDVLNNMVVVMKSDERLSKYVA
ncbi:MAG: DUF3015 domain-containing protein [Pseudomonadota bacterium]|nr:hypothetical protein [Pseudomonadales bacterium]MDY6921864.1 DUF3015 domain-containing protein [Pseudomonadota bacterium]